MAEVVSPVGIYVSVPFCRAKCTFCNFASGAFPPERMQAYVERLIAEIGSSRDFAGQHGLQLPDAADTIFFGGGTPSLLSPEQFKSICAALRSQFKVAANAEITVEAAPGQIDDRLLDAFGAEGVNRVSLGVQSFVDSESRAVGRLHMSADCFRELDRLAAAGIRNRNVDLIAGLPHQSAESWAVSLDAAIGSGAEHISVYMLEVDEDSRLGREVNVVRAESQLAVLGQHVKYSASAVPADDVIADMYAQACASLQAAGVEQYEISNFARPGFASRHNRKYWTRAPYIGLGLDAHSMLSQGTQAAGRFANVDELDTYLQGAHAGTVDLVDGVAAFEEAVFLGLRLNEGIAPEQLRKGHADALVDDLVARSSELQHDGLMWARNGRLGLTERGRVLSSSVFGELLAVPA